jgi:hypothetical protein
MSARGADFLENWIQKNVTAGAPPDDPLSASVLAMRCIAEAAAEGLTLEEIQPDSGSLESQIFDAMVQLAEPGTPGD